MPIMIGWCSGTTSASLPENGMMATSNNPAGTSTRPARVAVKPWTVWVNTGIA